MDEYPGAIQQATRSASSGVHVSPQRQDERWLLQHHVTWMVLACFSPPLWTGVSFVEGILKMYTAGIETFVYSTCMMGG
jgi:hypothetical protein